MMTKKDELVFYLQPVGNVDEKMMKIVGQILTKAFSGNTRVLKSIKIKLLEAGSYNAYQFAMKVYSQLRPGSDGVTRGIILGITESGRFYAEIPNLKACIGPLDGYAAQNGNVAIITLATYNEFRDEDGQENRARRALKNLVLHEMGHIFGATHCDKNCLMSPSPTRNEPSLEYCPSCAFKVRQRLEERTRHATDR